MITKEDIEKRKQELIAKSGILKMDGTSIDPEDIETPVDDKKDSVKDDVKNDKQDDKKDDKQNIDDKDVKDDDVGLRHDKKDPNDPDELRKAFLEATRDRATLKKQLEDRDKHMQELIESVKNLVPKKDEPKIDEPTWTDEQITQNPRAYMDYQINKMRNDIENERIEEYRSRTQIENKAFAESFLKDQKYPGAEELRQDMIDISHDPASGINPMGKIQHTLPLAYRLAFEKRCSTDQEFAKKYAVKNDDSKESDDQRRQADLAKAGARGNPSRGGGKSQQQSGKFDPEYAKSLPVKERKEYYILHGGIHSGE